VWPPPSNPPSLRTTSRLGAFSADKIQFWILDPPRATLCIDSDQPSGPRPPHFSKRVRNFHTGFKPDFFSVGQRCWWFARFHMKVQVNISGCRSRDSRFILFLSPSPRARRSSKFRQLGGCGFPSDDFRVIVSSKGRSTSRLLPPRNGRFFLLAFASSAAALLGGIASFFSFFFGPPLYVSTSMNLLLRGDASIHPTQTFLGCAFGEVPSLHLPYLLVLREVLSGRGGLVRREGSAPLSLPAAPSNAFPSP